MYICIYVYILSILIYHINPKVYHLINWLNKNLKIILFDVDVFIRKLSLMFKLVQLVGKNSKNYSGNIQ